MILKISVHIDNLLVIQIKKILRTFNVFYRLNVKQIFDKSTNELEISEMVIK